MGHNLSVQELVVPESWRGETLRSLKARAEFGVTVLAIHDTTTDEMIVPPDPDETLMATHTLLLAGPNGSLEQVTEMASADLE